MKALLPKIKDFSLFSQIKPMVLDHILAHAQVRHKKAGEVILTPESDNEKFYIVVSGCVKLFKETIDGAEAVVDIVSSGDFFGELGMSGMAHMPYGAEVVEDSELISIPRFILEEEILRNGLFGFNVLREITRQKNHRDMEIEHRTVQSAPQRIGCFLLKLCRSAETDAATLHLPYDKNTIASQLGMTPETFSRGLTRLREEAGLHIRGACVEIKSIRQLSTYTCSSCSSSFPCTDHLTAETQWHSKVLD